MAVTTSIESNTLLLVNVSDGKSADTATYTVYIKYSDDPTNSTELSDKPLAYIGIYVGTETEAPSDPSVYSWSKYGGESSYIDIRYSDSSGANKVLTSSEYKKEDGSIYTIADGLKPGAWMGVLVTDNSIVLDSTWYPEKKDEDNNLISNITLKDYTWTKIENSQKNYSIYIETEYNNIKKFFEYNDQTKMYNYVYSPETITFELKQSSFDGIDLLSGIFKYYCTYETEEGDIVESQIKTIETSSSSLTISLEEDNFIFTDEQIDFKTLNLQHLVVSAYIENKPIATKILTFDYGTSKEMAQLSLNAKDIVASIRNTSLTFNEAGLTIQNGGFRILNANREQVFYINDQTGDLYFSGELHSGNGTLGSWQINNYGLYDKEETVGLYAGGNFFHVDDTLKSPVRFWAGKKGEDVQDDNGNTICDYNFAVTHEGYLFAKQANIEGKIVATDGYISNRFLVGSANSGIVLFGGNETTDSYIGSALYSSGSMGYGWKLNQNGTAEFDNITARGTIQSSVFKHNRISSVGGSLYIAPTIYIEEESQPIEEISKTIEDKVITYYNIKWKIPYSSLLDLDGRDWKINDEVKIDGNILKNNDRIELSNITGTLIAANSNTNNNTTTITISFPTSQYNGDLTGAYFQPGAILVLYGSESRRHGLYLTATGADSPYIDVYDDSEDNTVKPAVRLGNLNGINDNNFPDTTLSGYGLYSSNAFLRGQLMLPGVGITNQKTIKYGEGEAASEIRIWAGFDIETEENKSITDANFIVTANGYMYAKQGVFEGTIKASNSEFSGTIKAAGIVIDQGGSGLNPISGRDHFFVAYTNEPKDFNDYVLDIGEHGLSIWEGALRAYSDYASEPSTFNTIYGYGTHNNIKYSSPLPYFTLADDGNGEELNARIVAYKGHFLTVSEESDKYKTNSVIINNGIELSQGSFANKNSIESTAYYNSLSLAKFSLAQLGDDVRANIEGINGINFRTSTLMISNETEDWSANIDEKVFIRGQLKLVNDDSDNLLSFNGQNIKEAKDADGTSLGIDFIIGG